LYRYTKLNLYRYTKGLGQAAYIAAAQNADSVASRTSIDATAADYATMYMSPGAARTAALDALTGTAAGTAALAANADAANGFTGTASAITPLIVAVPPPSATFGPGGGPVQAESSLPISWKRLVSTLEPVKGKNGFKACLSNATCTATPRRLARGAARRALIHHAVIGRHRRRPAVRPVRAHPQLRDLPGARGG
jgi:hypothetical protein